MARLDTPAAHTLNLSPVIRSLRITTDEIQFGRVLAAICQDAAVAAAFTSAVIQHARGGNQSCRRRVRARTSNVRCVEEHRLEARVGRRGLVRRASDRGRVDLDFSGSDGWRLIVEIKLGADIAEEQLEGYEQEGPVALIVRDATLVPPRRERPGWVGVATWESLIQDLRDLPVGPAWRAEWRGLLDVMERDGDFARIRPDGIPEVIEARDRLERAAPLVLERFRRELERKYQDGAAVAVKRLRHSPAWGKRGPWAGCSLRTSGDGRWLSFEVRNLWSPAPRLRLFVWHWPDARTRKHVRNACAQVPDGEDFRLLTDCAVFERPMPILENADADVIVSAVWDRLSQLVAVGVFDPEIRYQNRHYR